MSAADVRIDDRIRFKPQRGRVWWTVKARDEQYIIAVQQRPFHAKGELLYTIVDLTGWQDRKYNGAGNGIVRSSLNTLGGGYDVGDNGENCDQILTDLHNGWELSHRRLLDVDDIEVAS